MDQVVDQKIEEQKLAKLTANGENNEEYNSEREYKQPQILIDKVLDMYNEGKLKSKSEVKEHVGSNVATGFETSALITSYCVLMLAMHPEIQKLAYEEIVNYYGTDTKRPQVEYEDLNELPYLDRVLKETLRFFPVVPFFSRKLRKDFLLGK